ERRLSPEPAFAHGVSMVARVNDTGAVGEPGCRECIEYLAGLLIHKAAETVVAGNGAANICRRFEIVIEVEGLRVIADKRVIGTLASLIEQRHREIWVVEVVIEVLWRCCQRVVRRNERHKEHPGLIRVARRPFSQPDLGASCDIAIILGVWRFSRSCHAGHLVSGASNWKIVSNQTQ